MEMAKNWLFFSFYETEIYQIVTWCTNDPTNDER